jgi:hypothetical protein
MKCNCCGKELIEKQGIQREESLVIVKDWGYFSGKDMERHHLIICEACYDNWVSGFKIPPKVEDRTEAL